MFTAKDVMSLREMSGAGMMDCKKALTECNGDMDKAMDYLREKSLAASAKKAARIAAEGIVSNYVCTRGSCKRLRGYLYSPRRQNWRVG